MRRELKGKVQLLESAQAQILTEESHLKDFQTQLETSMGKVRNADAAVGVLAKEVRVVRNSQKSSSLLNWLYKVAIELTFENFHR